MASTTGFYGLQKLQAGDAISSFDYAFTNRNLDIIDRLLHKFDDALFSGSAPIADPTVALTAEALTTGGRIPAGRTLRYKYTWVDVNGNETAGSPETVVTTTSPVARPSQPSLNRQDTGGFLLAGNYFYIVSAWVDVNTAETSGSVSANINIPSGTSNVIEITFPSLPSGADGFNIFRRGPGETQFYFLDSVDLNVATPSYTYIDDNTITVTNSRTPSPTNLTYSSNSVVVTVPDEEVPDGYTWKLYRTMISGDFNSSLLEWVVSETFNGSGIISPSTTDYGGATSIGIPPTVSSITGNTNRIDQAEQDAADAIALLGDTPQGGYADVATRLSFEQDASQTGLVFITPTDQTFLSTTLQESIVVSEMRKVGQNGTDFIFEMFLMFEAASSEDMSFSISMLTVNATPTTFANIKYMVEQTSLVSGGSDGFLYSDGDVVTLNGDGTVRAVRLTGSIYGTSFLSDNGEFTFSVGVGSSVATPAGATLKEGSYLRLTNCQLL